MSDEITGILENWHGINHLDGSLIIYGEIYNDSLGRFHNGERIGTSKVKGGLIMQNGYVVTKSGNRYSLGVCATDRSSPTSEHKE